MIPIEPLMIGAAASALPRVIEALPKPGEFAGMLRDMVSGVASLADGDSKGSAASDSSFESQKQQAYGGLSSWIPSLDSFSMGGIFKELSETVNQFRSSVGRLLEEAGIDRTEKIRLQIDTSGKARVLGDRADAAAIEAVFEENPELRNQLAVIDSHAGLMRAAKRSEDFRNAYAANPVDAVARFEELLKDTSGPPATVVIGQDSFDILFD